MTTQTAVAAAETELTLTAKLFTLAAPDTVAYTADSVTEQTNAKGEYVCTFEEVAEISGDYTLILFDGTRPASIAKRTFAGTDGEVSTVTKVAVELDPATQTQVTNIENASGYLLAVLAGACADPQTASETYAITVFGSTFTVDMAGQTSAGVRTAPTLTKS